MAKSITGFYLSLGASLISLILGVIGFLKPANYLEAGQVNMLLSVFLGLAYFPKLILAFWLVLSVLLLISSLMMLKNAKTAGIAVFIIGVIFGLFSGVMVSISVSILSILAAGIAISEAQP